MVAADDPRDPLLGDFIKRDGTHSSEYVPTGRCCENGMFGEDHDCQKQDGAEPDTERDYIMTVQIELRGHGKESHRQKTVEDLERYLRVHYGMAEKPGPDEFTIRAEVVRLEFPSVVRDQAREIMDRLEADGD